MWLVLLLSYPIPARVKLVKHTVNALFLITTLQPVARGTEGAISLEGTITGIIASGAIALLGYLTNLINPIGIVICLISAFIATNLESVIGATLQEKNRLANQ